MRARALTTRTVPNQTVKAILRLDGKLVAEKDLFVEAAQATTFEVSLASAAILPGAVFAAEFLQGERSLLAGQTTLQ